MSGWTRSSDGTGGRRGGASASFIRDVSVAVAIDVDVVVASRRRSRRPTRGAARAPRRRAAAATTAMTTTSEHEARRARTSTAAPRWRRRRSPPRRPSTPRCVASARPRERRRRGGTTTTTTTTRAQVSGGASSGCRPRARGTAPCRASDVSRAPTTSDEASRCLRLWLKKQQRAARAASALSSGRARAPLGSTTAPAML